MDVHISSHWYDIVHFGPRSSWLCFWTLSKRRYTNGYIVHTYKLMILPTSSQCGTLVAHLTILPSNKGPPSLPSNDHPSVHSLPTKILHSRLHCVGVRTCPWSIKRALPDSRACSILVNSSSLCWGQDMSVKHSEHTSYPIELIHGSHHELTMSTIFIWYFEDFIHMAKSESWLWYGHHISPHWYDIVHFGSKPS